MMICHVAALLAIFAPQAVLGYVHYVTAETTEQELYAQSAGCITCTGGVDTYRDGILIEAAPSTGQIILNFHSMSWATSGSSDCNSFIRIYDGKDTDGILTRTLCQPDDITITMGSNVFITYSIWTSRMWFRVNYQSQLSPAETSGLSSRTKGLIAGGVIFALVVAGAAAFFCRKSKPKKRSPKPLTTGTVINPAPTSTSMGGNNTTTRVYPTTTNHAMTNNSTTYPPANTRLPPLNHLAYPPTSNNPAYPPITNQQPYPSNPNNLGFPTPSNNTSFPPASQSSVYPPPEANTATPSAPPPPALYNPEHLPQNNATKPPPPSYIDVMSQPQKY